MEEIINTIADLLDQEECVFLHRETFDILSFPDPDRNEVWEDDYLIDEVLEESSHIELLILRHLGNLLGDLGD